MSTSRNSFGSRATIQAGGMPAEIFRLDALKKKGFDRIDRIPFSLRVLLENLLRHEDGDSVTAGDIEALASWSPGKGSGAEIAFRPARVLLQDFTGVPSIADLAAMRDAIRTMGGDPAAIKPLQPADLVIDHSVQVDVFGSDKAFMMNAEKEMARNRERYVFLRWGQQAFDNFRVVPPDTGIVHQVNLEYLAQVVFRAGGNGSAPVLYPDTLVGTDSHTTMINGLGVVGWGVGGIEAEAAMLGQPISMLVPDVIGFKLNGTLPAGATATDLVLTVTRMLRQEGVVGKFVEFFGPGLAALSLPDRATIANMAPEYGATIGFFPVDEETVRYLSFTGRAGDLVKAYYQEQGLFRTIDTPDPEYTKTVELDLGSIEPSLAGPHRPQDQVPLKGSKQAFRTTLASMLEEMQTDPGKSAEVALNGSRVTIGHGSVVIAAITSCTNTSNPAVMIGAGLLAKKAVDRGLTAKPWVKTSLAPGSKVVVDYLKQAGLMPALEALNFHLVGFGCTTCIGNSGPLPQSIADAVKSEGLVVVSVLSGNRNFEGRINPHVRANYLASPPLVVAYALAGSMDIDLYKEPLGKDPAGKPVYLKEIWPTPEEVGQAMGGALTSEMFARQYGEVFDGDERWKALEVPSGDTFTWEEDSTYIKRPPFFEDMPVEPSAPQDIRGARVLALLGDSVTTDHISPAGSIPEDGPAGQYLVAQGVAPADFNSFGARRGNHEVMVRGTFGNIRLRNKLAPGTEGGWTVHQPDGKQMRIYDAAMKYRDEGVPTIVIAGKEYGTGSSRDWAAKGPQLLGVRAVIAESFERIHRSNLAGMGILPLQFKDGDAPAGLGLTGKETFAIAGLANLSTGDTLTVTAEGDGGKKTTFEARVRLDTPREVEYFRHGGILQFVLRNLLSGR